MIWLLFAGIIASIISVLVLFLIPLAIRLDSVRSEGKIKGSIGISWLVLQLRYTLKEKRAELFIFGHRITRIELEDIILFEKPIRVLPKKRHS